MRVNITAPNPALISIIHSPEQVITLDANFLIPPDRSRITNREVKFSSYKEMWLDPIFDSFPKLAIHEAVYDELVNNSSKAYINVKLSKKPPGIIIHRDSSLTEEEKVLRNTIEQKIALFTRYEPSIDNKHDRGEVKSLSYIAVKGLLYFAAHDNNAINLIENAQEWSTGLDNVQVIKMYELIYYLHRKNVADNKALKALYKYQYFLTHNEKKTNPEWSMFISSMDNHYSSFFVKKD
jgi:hypothetical protein